MRYPNLFKPLKIKNTVFRNRIFAAPNMVCLMTGDGAPSPQMIGYYAAKARGGAAQVTIGDTPVDEEHAPSMINHIKLTKDTLPWLHELATAIKLYGAVASFELNHGGFVSSPAAMEGRNPIGPVSFVREDGVAVEAMDEAMMEHVADNFAAAAALIKKAGFDMCLLHGGHGWLLHQFLSPVYNTRADEFGGSLQNRAKFPVMVIDQVRRAVGKDFLIEYRMSGSECTPGGLTTEDAVEFAKMIEDKVDILHVSAAVDITDEGAVITHPTIYLPHCVNVPYAAAVKKAVSIPVVTIGAIATPEEAEEIISSGQADIVGMTRNLIADPNYPAKAKAGMSEDIVPCLRCLDCLTGLHEGPTFSCAVNPITGRESFMEPRLPEKAKRPLTVLIAGGGPGGMTAAVTAAGLGHNVILAESSDRLGGWMNFTDYDPLKADLKRLRDHLVYKAEKSGARIMLNTAVTPEYIARVGPDAVIAAVGSTPLKPPIPGLDAPGILHAADAYRFDPDTIGRRVAVIGGGLVGCEFGIHMADCGKSVTIIEMQENIAPEANWMHLEGMKNYMDGRDITVKTETRCKEIRPGGVVCSESGGIESFVPADTVVYALGMASRKLQTPDNTIIRCVGDCVRPRKVRHALYEGFAAGLLEL